MDKVINNNTHTRNTGASRTRENLTTPKNVENLVCHAEVSEKVIEQYLVESAKQNGLLCLKYSNPNQSGYPDRLLVLPSGRVIWVELKSKGRKPTKLQQLRHERLACMDHRVYVIDSKSDIDKLINGIEK